MKKKAIKALIRAFAVIGLIVGGIGCLSLIPFAISNNLVFVGMTGLYFVAGGVLIAGSLVSLSVLTVRT